MTNKEAATIVKRIRYYMEGSECWTDAEFIAMDMAVKALEQPEIVTCKDCKYWREHKYAKETKRYIPFCGFNAIYTKADDFCSRAERRTDEAD